MAAFRLSMSQGASPAASRAVMLSFLLALPPPRSALSGTPASYAACAAAAVDVVVGVGGSRSAGAETREL